MNTTTAWMAWILVQFSVQILLWEKLVSGGGNSSFTCWKYLWWTASSSTVRWPKRKQFSAISYWEPAKLENLEQQECCRTSIGRHMSCTVTVSDCTFNDANSRQCSQINIMSGTKQSEGASNFHTRFGPILCRNLHPENAPCNQHVCTNFVRSCAGLVLCMRIHSTTICLRQGVCRRVRWSLFRAASK